MKTITVGRGRYKTIASIYPIPQNVSKVVVLAGTYNEQLILASNVTFELQKGAIIDYNSSNDLPTVFSNNYVANCNIIGGDIKRTNSHASVLSLDYGSSINISGVNITDDRGEYGASYGAVFIADAKVTFNGNMTTKGTSIQIRKGTLDGTGNLYSERDYTLWVSGDSNDENCIVNWQGNITSNLNSAIGIYGGQLTYEGYALSNSLFGFEMGGGNNVLLKNSTIESKNPKGYQEGDAISKYGGVSLTLDNCTMISLPGAYSISEQGRADSVTLITDCYANRNKSPIIEINGNGKLIIK